MGSLNQQHEITKNLESLDENVKSAIINLIDMATESNLDKVLNAIRTNHAEMTARFVAVNTKVDGVDTKINLLDDKIDTKFNALNFKVVSLVFLFITYVGFAAFFLEKAGLFDKVFNS